jgi:hypothetical protein
MLVDVREGSVGVADGSSVAIRVGSVVRDGWGAELDETLQQVTQSETKTEMLIHRKTFDRVTGGLIKHTPLYSRQACSLGDPAIQTVHLEHEFGAHRSKIIVSPKTIYPTNKLVSEDL